MIEIANIPEIPILSESTKKNIILLNQLENQHFLNQPKTSILGIHDKTESTESAKAQHSPNDQKPTTPLSTKPRLY